MDTAQLSMDLDATRKFLHKKELEWKHKEAEYLMEIAGLKKENKALNDGSQSLEKEIEEFKYGNSEVDASMKRQLKNFSKTIKDLRAENKALKEESEEINHQGWKDIAMRTSEFEKLKEQLYEHKQSNLELKEEINQSDRRLDRAKQYLTDYCADCDFIYTSDEEDEE